MILPNNTLLQGGKYKITRFIASGGFGCTYEGVHTMLDTKVAIKEFFPKMFCNRDENTSHVTVATQGNRDLVAKLRKKFNEEAIAVFRMKHDNIVRVLDVFEENGTAYYVMEYVDGKSLNEIVKERGALPEAEAVGYIRQVAEALKYVHSLNRLHLDIKPGNIMVDKNGKAILIDFGASKHYDDESGENTSTLLGVNTKGYAPIEQTTQSFSSFSPATDIYALGATLYKLLTGITPPDANLLMIEEVALQPLPSAISSATQNAVSKSMQLRRVDRPQTISEFLDAFINNSGQKDIDINQSSCFDVILKNAGSNKLQIINFIREVLALEHEEAKVLVDNVPSVIIENLTKSKAEEIRHQLEDLGADIVLKKDGIPYYWNEESTEEETVVDDNPIIQGLSSSLEDGRNKISYKNNDSRVFDVILAKIGWRDQSVINLVQELTGVSPYIAKNVPSVIKTKLPKTEAEELKKRIESLGATIILKEAIEVRDDCYLYDVVLEDVGWRNLTVPNFLMKITGLKIEEVKQLIAQVPCIIRKSLSKTQAEDIKHILETKGAVVSLRKCSLNINNLVEGNNPCLDSISKVGINIEEGHEWVDLGLPSGIKWATCNIGANKDSEQGYLFAWGETKTKSEYTELNSETYKKGKKFFFLGDGLKWLKDNGYIDNFGNLTPGHDAATLNWGGKWRMPTQEDMGELVEKCKWRCTTMDGRNGYLVTGRNGNSIFFPVKKDSMDEDENTNADYWCSTVYDGYETACALNIIANAKQRSSIGYWALFTLRFIGCLIRPVIH